MLSTLAIAFVNALRTQLVALEPAGALLAAPLGTLLIALLVVLQCALIGALLGALLVALLVVLLVATGDMLVATSPAIASLVSPVAFGRCNQCPVSSVPCAPVNAVCTLLEDSSALCVLLGTRRCLAADSYQCPAYQCPVHLAVAGRHQYPVYQ